MTALVVVDSLGVVVKFAGTPCALAYVVLGGGVCFLLLHRIDAYRETLASRVRRPGLVFGLLILAVVLVFAVGYPLANSGAWGPGTDSDEAIQAATSRLLRGQYPYATKTYLGNPISPMPGTLILSVPFVLMGRGALQNVFWIAAAGLLLARKHGFLLSVALLLHLLVLAPEVMHLLVIGTDYIANTAYVLLVGAILLRLGSRAGSDWRSFPTAAAWGLTLSSRANFLTLVPMVFLSLARRRGWARATLLGAVTASSFGLVTLPFYLADPGGFSPLHTSNKLAVAGTVVPFPEIVIPLLMALIGVLVAWRDGCREDVFLLASAAALTVPMVADVVGEIVADPGANGWLDYLYFGTFPMLAAVTGYYLGAWPPRPVSSKIGSPTPAHGA